MTRRDYIALAAALARVRPPNSGWQTTQNYRAWRNCRDSIATTLAHDPKVGNPNFDLSKFNQACEENPFT